MDECGAWNDTDMAQLKYAEIISFQWHSVHRKSRIGWPGTEIEPTLWEVGVFPEGRYVCFRDCMSLCVVCIIIIIIIIIIIEFLTSQLWLGNIHLSWDVVINRIRLGGLICSLKSFLQLNMYQEL